MPTWRGCARSTARGRASGTVRRDRRRGWHGACVQIRIPAGDGGRCRVPIAGSAPARMAVSPLHAADLAPRAKPPLASPSLGAAARFVLAPGALIGAAGLLHRGDPTVAVPAVDWREATVDVVI